MKPNERAAERDRTCDHKGCANTASYYCGCERCDREPSSTEAFFACAAHRNEVDAYHRRVRGRRAKWYVGTEEHRAQYLRPR